MKKVFSCFLCMILLCTLLPALADSVSDVMQVANCESWVSLRESPQTNAKRIKKVHLGELVTFCQADANGFVRCVYDGQTGYILQKYLKKTSYTLYDEVLPNQVVTNCEDYVSQREQPDTSSNRIQKIPQGAVVTACIRYTDAFTICTYKGKTGFVSTKYLRKADYSWEDLPNKTYPSLPSAMRVINVNEWVSLREHPTSYSIRLQKVPLGATVYNCVQVSDSFAKCTYGGKTGYISLKYLENAATITAVPYSYTTPTPYSYTTPAPYITSVPYTTLPPVQPDPDTEEEDMISLFTLPQLPGYAEFNALGESILEAQFQDLTICVRRSWAGMTEQMVTVCYDQNLSPLWSDRRESGEVTELSLTGAFIAGTEANPRLVLFVANQAFTCFDIARYKQICWVLPLDENVQVSGGITPAVTTDGTIYVCGMYSAAPVCISPEGVLLWQAVCDNPNIYWPFNILVTEDGYIDVDYDSYHGEENRCYVGRYRQVDGALLQIFLKDLPEDYWQ